MRHHPGTRDAWQENRGHFARVLSHHLHEGQTSTPLSRPNRAGTGFTLVEMLVVLAVVALLISITIPAVMQARESARKAQCANNLRQIGLAIHGHLTHKGYFPREENTYSALVFLLPYLDERPLFNSLNFSQARIDWGGDGDANDTAFLTTVNVFICPSDPLPPSAYGATNYGGNLGVGEGKFLRPDNGPFASALGSPAIKEASIPDGFAQTMAVSEFCRTNHTDRQVVHSVYKLGKYFPGQFNQFVTDCFKADQRTPIDKLVTRGLCWGFDGLFYTTYDHNIPPNGPTCDSDSNAPSAWTANSLHAHGVNGVHLDGHVSFISSSVSLATWRASGTMNGSEVVNGDSL